MYRNPGDELEEFKEFVTQIRTHRTS